MSGGEQTSEYHCCIYFSFALLSNRKLFWLDLVLGFAAQVSKDDCSEFDVSLARSSADPDSNCSSGNGAWISASNAIYATQIVFMMRCNRTHHLVISVLQNLSASMSSSLAVMTLFVWFEAKIF